MTLGDQFVGKAAEENDERENHAVLEEDLLLRAPGNGDEEQGKRGPGYENPSIVEIGAGEEHECCRAEIGQDGGGVNLLVEGEWIRGSFRKGNSRRKWTGFWCA